MSFRGSLLKDTGHFANHRTRIVNALKLTQGGYDSGAAKWCFFDIWSHCSVMKNSPPKTLILTFSIENKLWKRFSKIGNFTNHRVICFIFHFAKKKKREI